jgi:hypothetical protein
MAGVMVVGGKEGQGRKNGVHVVVHRSQSMAHVAVTGNQPISCTLQLVQHFRSMCCTLNLHAAHHFNVRTPSCISSPTCLSSSNVAALPLKRYCPRTLHRRLYTEKLSGPQPLLICSYPQLIHLHLLFGGQYSLITLVIYHNCHLHWTQCVHRPFLLINGPVCLGASFPQFLQSLSHSRVRISCDLPMCLLLAVPNHASLSVGEVPSFHSLRLVPCTIFPECAVP